MSMQLNCHILLIIIIPTKSVAIFGVISFIYSHYNAYNIPFGGNNIARYIVVVVIFIECICGIGYMGEICCLQHCVVKRCALGYI